MLNSVPAVPTLSDVAMISVVMSNTLQDKIGQLVSCEGHVWERAPVQIDEAIEQPGSLLVKWSEVCYELIVNYRFISSPLG